MNWIHIRKQRPKMDEWVLVWDAIDEFVTKAKLSPFEDCWIYAENLNHGDDVEYVEHNNVSHWMHLPEKPQ